MIPTYQKVSQFGSAGFAFYASGKLFKDSDTNMNMRSLGALCFILNQLGQDINSLYGDISSLEEKVDNLASANN